MVPYFCSNLTYSLIVLVPIGLLDSPVFSYFCCYARQEKILQVVECTLTKMRENSPGSIYSVHRNTCFNFRNTEMQSLSEYFINLRGNCCIQ